MNRLAPILALSALLAIGCGSGRFVQRGIDAYDRLDYRAAMAQWTELSDDEADLNAKGFVRYMVYRGLTHYHLGQRPAAMHYLSRGRAVYERNGKKYLKPEIVAEMDRALADLAQSPAPPPPVQVIVLPPR